MWEVTEENEKLLRTWASESGSKELREKVNFWTKKSPLALEFDELMTVLQPLADECPIYQFIDGLRIYKPKIEKKVDPAYQARIEKLRRQQEDKEYMEMTRTIDPSQHYGSKQLMGNFGEELKSVNRHLIVVFNTIVTVGGAFSFGFFGLNYAYPDAHLDIATRMMIGLVLGSVVFFADLYFIVKAMGGLDDATAVQSEAPRKQSVRPVSRVANDSKETEATKMAEAVSNVKLKGTAKQKPKRSKKID